MRAAIALLAASFLATAGQAFAQEPPPKEPPPPPPARHRAGPPPPSGKSFDLRLGTNRGLRVDCGDETLADCVEAANPLLERLENLEQRSPPATGNTKAQ